MNACWQRDMEASNGHGKNIHDVRGNEEDVK